MKRMIKKNSAKRPYSRKPVFKLLVATHDKDPNAVVIDVTPVDLSGARCPLCGRKDGEHAG